MLLIGYLVCYFIALMFLKIVFDWTKDETKDILKSHKKRFIMVA